IYSNQHLIGTNEEVGELCRRELGEDFDESAYRKVYQSFDLIFQDIKEQILDKEYLDELDQKMDEMYKQQIKTRDVLREKRKTLRDEARIEVLIDAIRENAESYPTIKPVYSKELLSIKDGNEAILCISDWHVGMTVDNFRNKYNEEILEQRVQTLYEKTVAYCKMANVTKLHAINMGDFMAGNIYGSIRVESELDTIEQVKKSASLIYQLLMRLSEHIPSINYRSCLDNHSRVNKDYKEHIEKESFANLTSWWLEAKLEGTGVKMVNDNIDPNIGHFILENGKKIFFVHGHLEKISTVIQDLTFGTNIIPDIVLCAHFHSDKMKNFQGKRLYINGSLIGTDSYALNNRLFGDPTQTLLIFNNKETMDIRINV
ncbi:MAG: hypothetical protein PHT30_04620, partial [Bacilli bacterium]|nr:hypothetical protein [Bacilli bacterium]